MIRFCKKWWFYIITTIITISVVAVFAQPITKKPYKDYLFYGITQRINNDKLEILYTTRAFPPHKHTVYAEIMKPNGEIDWLSTEEHTGTHKAHYHRDSTKIKPYKAFYNIKNLKPGKYKLRVTFDFKYGIFGHINPVSYYSNWVKFEVK